jgi:HEAT repeat protein
MTPPWSKKPEKPPRPRVAIKSPYQRMAELRELAKTAPSMSPEDQQRAGRPVAEQFRSEGDPLIRAQMVRTLEKFKTAEAAAVLSQAMEDSSIDVRIAACQAWGSRGGPEAVQLLGQRIGSDTNVDVRLAAARALGETGDQNAVPKLALALDDSDPALQYRAVLSLQKVTGKKLDNDVNQWRQYVKGEKPTQPAPMSMAERVRRLF